MALAYPPFSPLSQIIYSKSIIKLYCKFSNSNPNYLFSQLFSGDDTLAGSYNLSLDMDMFRSPPSGNITGNNDSKYRLLSSILIVCLCTGNEVIAYGYQGLFDVDEQLTEATGTNSQTMLEPEGTSDKDAADLFDLLDVPQTSTSASSTKKRKKN